jgi:iron(III) transport system substrate-binding protein
MNTLVKLALFFLLSPLTSCFNSDKRTEVWIYTSLYKDTIAEMTPALEKKFPDIKIQWYQAGSEDIASKINTELLAGEAKADLLISSERFWYQELSDNKQLHTFKPDHYEHFLDEIKNPEMTFHVASIPAMVIVYNNEAITDQEAPKTFKDLVDGRLKDKVNGGSPLASGTNFTTMAALQTKYGWDYFKKLKANNTLLEGGKFCSHETYPK